MKLHEFMDITQNTDKPVLPFDIVDDIVHYIENDPLFYRKKFFPVLEKLKMLKKKHKHVDYKKILKPVVDSAIVTYCNKFKLGSPEYIIDKEDIMHIIEKLYENEFKSSNDDIFNRQRLQFESSSTSAGAIASVAAPTVTRKKKNKKPVKNALDSNVNLFTGEVMKRNM